MESTCALLLRDNVLILLLYLCGTLLYLGWYVCGHVSWYSYLNRNSTAESSINITCTSMLYLLRGNSGVEVSVFVSYHNTGAVYTSSGKWPQLMVDLSACARGTPVPGKA